MFLKAADLLAGPWRATVNAATMLGQSKTAFQAEIDSACELIDFWRFNVHFAERLLPGAAGVGAAHLEPDGPPAARRVRLRHHAVQLHGHRRQPAHRARALMGNVAHLEAGAHRAAQQLLRDEAAGGGGAAARGDQLRAGRCGAGDQQAAAGRPRRWPASTSPAPPRCSSRCGGRWARTWRATPAIRGSWARPAARTSCWRTRAPMWTRWRWRWCAGAFEYQGQKCSAASRAYVPASLWPGVKERVLAMHGRHPDGRRRATSATSWAR